MTLKHDLQAYQSSWTAVEARQQAERAATSLELRWRQLNAAYGIAKAAGLLKPDPSETGVWERWAKIKEQTINPSRPT